jgi:hypothetical protein
VETDCEEADGGYYVQFPGQQRQTTKIVAGYHANGEKQQTIPNPYICPVVHYCPEGTETALPCPNGYWTPYRGAKSENECITCERGHFCNFANMHSQTNFITWMQQNSNANADFTFAELTDPSTGYADIGTYYG